MADSRVNDAMVALKTKVQSLEGLANSVDEVHSQLQAMSDALKETQVRGNERAEASFAAAQSVARRLEEVVRHISALLALPDADGIFGGPAVGGGGANDSTGMLSDMERAKEMLTSSCASVPACRSTYRTCSIDAFPHLLLLLLLLLLLRP